MTITQLTEVLSELPENTDVLDDAVLKQLLPFNVTFREILYCECGHADGYHGLCGCCQLDECDCDGFTEAL